MKGKGKRRGLILLRAHSLVYLSTSDVNLLLVRPLLFMILLFFFTFFFLFFGAVSLLLCRWLNKYVYRCHPVPSDTRPCTRLG